MSKQAIGLLVTISFSAIVLSWISFPKTERNIVASEAVGINRTYGPPFKEILKLQTKAVAAKAFARKNHFDTSVSFLIDMSLPANHKRFFVYSLEKSNIQNSGLVTHGNCNQYWLEGRKYGNEIGCGCTSLGKYKVGNSYYGKFGLAFKLRGLETSNSNAFKRYVVLHSHSCVPNNEVREEICQSNGCPTVSTDFFTVLAAIIKKSNRPILLWIFD
jgi:hypothetical protein